MSSQPAITAARLAQAAFLDHSVDLRRFLIQRVANAHDADDLAQEVFTRLLRVRNADLVQNPLAYMLGIATHVVHEFFQRQRYAKVLFDSELAGSIPESHERMMQQGVAENLELKDRLDRALTRLPVTHRLVILLVKREGLSYQEAARSLGLSVHTVEKYVVEARALLRTILADMDR